MAIVRQEEINEALISAVLNGWLICVSEIGIEEGPSGGLLCG